MSTSWYCYSHFLCIIFACVQNVKLQMNICVSTFNGLKHHKCLFYSNLLYTAEIITCFKQKEAYGTILEEADGWILGFKFGYSCPQIKQNTVRKSLCVVIYWHDCSTSFLLL